MPASVAYSVPPATAPRVPREARRTRRSAFRGCPQPRVNTNSNGTASLSVIMLLPLYGMYRRARQGQVGGCLTVLGSSQQHSLCVVRQTVNLCVRLSIGPGRRLTTAVQLSRLRISPPFLPKSRKRLSTSIWLESYLTRLGPTLEFSKP
jgi:hypothetical protein